MSVRTLTRQLFPRTARRTTAARFAFWGVQRLEDRVTPALNIWTGTSGDWSDASHWSELHVPTSDEDVIINFAGATVTHAAGTDPVHSLQVAGADTLVLSGGTINVAGTLDVQPDSHFNLTGGTLNGATVTAGSTITVGSAFPGGTLSGVTLAGTLDLTTTGSHATVANGLTLDGGTVRIGDAVGGFAYLSFDGTQTLGGAGTVALGTSSDDLLQVGPTAGSHLTIGPDVLVRGASGTIGYRNGFPGDPNVSFTFEGTVRAEGTNGVVNLNAATWVNTGTVRSAGSAVSLAGAWTNSGTLVSAADVGTIAAATESGTTVTVSTAAAHGFVPGQTVAVVGVGVAEYNGNFAITSVPTPTTFTYTHFLTGLADSGGGTATLLNSALNLGGTFATPTLGTVASTGGAVNVTGTLTNTGSTLTLDATTGSWRLVGGTIVGGTVATTSGTSIRATTTTGTLTGVTLAGTLDLTTTGSHATVANGLTLDNGTVRIGDAVGGFAYLSLDGTQTLGGTGSVVFGTTPDDLLQVGPTAGSHLTIGPNILLRGTSGTVGYRNGFPGSADVTFTNQGTIRADTPGGAITVNGSGWTNAGTLEATGGGSLNLFSTAAAGPAWTSATPLTVVGGGTLDLRGPGWSTAGITATGSTVNLGGSFAAADLGTFNRTGGTVNLTGTLANAGQTLALDATSGSWQLATGGVIDGGRVTTADGATLVAAPDAGSPTGTLAGVTLAGTLDLTTFGSHARVTGGLTLDNGTVRIGNAAGDYAYLSFDGTQTLGGTGTVALGTTGDDLLQVGPTAGSHLTIGPDVLVRGASGTVGYRNGFPGSADVTFTNQGTIRADTPGGTLTLDGVNWTNAGTVRAEGGGTVRATGTNTNFAAGTLTGGTWEAADGTVRLLDAAIATNAATVVLDGPNAHVYRDESPGTTDALGGLTANAAGGSLTVNGQTVTVGGRFTNAGTLTVGPGGTFAVTDQFASEVRGFSSEYQPSPGGYSASQATGPSNTPTYGDHPTAWAPLLPNSGSEFLTVGFATPDFADGVIVRETNGNGFVTQVDAIDTNNVSHTVWPVGTETDTSPQTAPVDFLAAWPRTPYRVKAVKIYVDSSHSGTWEEIDSVRLVGPNTAFVQTGGGTRVQAGGTLTVSAGDPVAVQGGTLEGTGTIAADVTNAAVVAPGPGLGTLTVTGNYAQAAAGTLAVEIGGTAPGQADRLNVAGTTSLDGALDVGFINGFVPAILDHFTLLDPTGGGPIAGTFAGLDEGATFSVPGPATFRVTYAGGGNDVALTALNIAPTLDPIPDQPVPNGPLVLEDGGPHTVSLTGISSGNAQAQTLTVTATSSDPTVIPDPGVAYTSPDAAGTLTYQPAANRSGDVVITVTVSDDGGTGDGGVSQVVRQFTVHVLPVNDEPTLDPISDPTAIPPIPDPDPIPEDAGQQTINLTGISAGGDETQTLTVTATSSDPTIVPEPTVTYSTPDATGSLTYTPLPNQYGTVTITVRVTDDGGTANGGDDEVVRTFTVTVEPRPDAPTLDTDPLTVLPPIPVRTRLTPDPTGTLVADLIAHKTTDADGDPVGIAVIGLDPANTVNLKGVPKFGVWEFTTDGTLWNLIPTGPTGVSATSALVLSADAQTRVRFKPNLLFHGLSRFTFLAWDHSDGATPGLPADTTATPTAYSARAETAWVAVGKTRPNVDARGATRLAAVREDAKASQTFLAKGLLGLAGLENAPAAGLGVAITGVSTDTGTWYYRLAKTKDFIAIDPAQGALRLRPTDTVRFVPAHDANGQGDLTLKTWVPDANFGTYAADTTGTEFGPDSGAASIAIVPVNDAPVLNPALHPDLGTATGGQTIALTVADLLALAPGVGTDVDSTNLGVQLLPASGKVGKWQYFDVAANKMRTVTTPKVLKADVQIQFVVAPGAVAGAYNLSFKVWDTKLVSKVVGTATLTVG